MASKKWTLLFIFFVAAFVLMADIIAAFTYFFAKVYLYFVQGIPFGAYLPGFLKLLKGATFGGVIAGSGCWWIHYRHNRR